jgi:hypothetical protein
MVSTIILLGNPLLGSGLVQSEMSWRACGPRNLMKMVQSKIVRARSGEVATLNRAVEAVEMSDPECA